MAPMFAGSKLVVSMDELRMYLCLRCGRRLSGGGRCEEISNFSASRTRDVDMDVSKNRATPKWMV